MSGIAARLRQLRIGYFPGSPAADAPSDRRRFVRYAASRGLNFELADPAVEYDLVVLNQRADLSVWSRLPRGRTRIVYDAIDSYVTAGNVGWKGKLRGLSKFVTRQSRHLQLDYGAAVEAMCRRADAVVCSTEEQRQRIASLCDDVRIILDVHDGEVGPPKQDYARGEVIRLVWEGLASSGIPWAMFRELLDPAVVGARCELHLVTDVVYRKYHDKYVRRHVIDDAWSELGPLARAVHVHQWSPLALNSIATACDLALIPIDLGNAFHRGKPENKLLIFWRLGVPTLVSATPAYGRAMQAAGLDGACTTLDDWRARLRRAVSDQAWREQAGRLGRRAADERYSEAEMLGRWDAVFASALGLGDGAEGQGD